MSDIDGTRKHFRARWIICVVANSSSSHFKFAELLAMHFELSLDSIHAFHIPYCILQPAFLEKPLQPAGVFPNGDCDGEEDC